MKNEKLKLCFAASSGGHLEELMMLRPLMGRYDSFIVTERTLYEASEEGIRFYYLQQVNRREKSCFLRLLANAFLSLRILSAEQPDVVITTGVLAVIPLCLLSRIWGAKLVFIESFANVHSPTRTGKFLYWFADRFYVQWPELLEFYPGAVYLGGIY